MNPPFHMTMKTTFKTACLLPLAGLARLGGEFRNLGFEEADPELLVPYTWGYWDRMVPGWISDVPGNTVGYNQSIHLTGYFMLIDNWGRERSSELSLCPVVDRLAIGVIPRAYLNSKGQPVSPPVLQQSGRVPAWAYQLRFVWKGERLDLFLNGQPTPFTLAEERLTDDPFVPVHRYYAADVSAYAGREITLRFEFRANAVHGFPDWPNRVATLDDLHFLPIPGPAPGTLLLLGGLGFGGRRGVNPKAEVGRGAARPACPTSVLAVNRFSGRLFGNGLHRRPDQRAGVLPQPEW
jgi:hypothetical protein